VAHCIGGSYERIEGTIDLMPNDLVYHTYINREGEPRPTSVRSSGTKNVSPPPFLNEVNRARQQVHSLLLWLMADKRISAFNREDHFPYLSVFADRD
jgi:MoxR-like ATPase